MTRKYIAVLVFLLRTIIMTMFVVPTTNFALGGSNYPALLQALVVIANKVEWEKGT